MNVLDLLLLCAAVGFAISGYRQGFVVGVLSVAGFVGCGLLALRLLPFALHPLGNGTVQSVAAVVAVIVCASLGQALTTHLGGRLRGRLVSGRRREVRLVDAVGGALVNVLAVLVVAWLLGAALAGTSLPTVSREVRQSRVLDGVQAAMPTAAPGWVSELGRTLAANGFPQVFGPGQDEPIADVPPPDARLARSAAVRRAGGSIVKVQGTATSCSKVLEGSGFVYAPHRVVTNAHVVGGVREPTVQIGGRGKLYDARTVLYDWRRDIAVLDVPGLDARPLEFARGGLDPQDGAIIAGFPENGAFDVRAARVRRTINASGPDIYRRGDVTRRVYSLYAGVRQGNSGGPLLDPQGRVAGVVFAKSLDDKRTGYALTAGEVQGDLAVGRRAGTAVSTQGCAM